MQTDMTGLRCRRWRLRCRSIRRRTAEWAAVLLVTGLAGTRVASAAGPRQNSAAVISGQTATQSSRSAEQDNCSSCHADAAKELTANPHSTGAQQVHCNDCHTPHGSAPSKRSQSVAEQNASCIRCHGEMAGPFEYEHPPVRVEGCVSCHAAHGSQRPHFLTSGGVPTICLQCHAISKTSLHAHDISADGLVRNRSGQYVPCTDCHRDIHGSNVSKVFFRPEKESSRLPR